MKPLRLVLYLLASAVLLFLYLHGAVRQSRQLNTNMRRVDQFAYMSYAKALADSGYGFVGDRNRMPLYPTLLSLVYEPGLSDEEFFSRGIRLNIALSIVFLCVLSWITARNLPPAGAIPLILIATFLVFIFKAGWVQSEVLFYFLTFSCFLLMNRMLWRPDWRYGISTGVMLGLAHLTKASVMVGLGVFVAVGLLQEARALYRERYRPGQPPHSHRDGTVRWLAVLIVPAVFLLIIFPYLRNSKAVYGRYFYNVNTTFYFWYDSWNQAKQGTRAHGDRIGWPEIPPESIPSASKYWREHSARSIVSRLAKGVRVIAHHSVRRSYGYAKYVVLYVGFSLLLMILERGHTVRLFREHAGLWIFNLGYFTTYLALYAWYTPIADGRRLVLAQLLPLLFALSVVIFRLYSRRRHLTWGSWRIDLSVAFTFVLACLLSRDILLVLTDRIVKIHGGW